MTQTVELAQVLEAREHRARRQQALLAICWMLHFLREEQI